MSWGRAGQPPSAPATARAVAVVQFVLARRVHLAAPEAARARRAESGQSQIQPQVHRERVAAIPPGFATSPNPTLKIVNGLRVSASKDEQYVLDNQLSDRVVEFETGSTILALSQTRADAVRDYLVDKGMPVSRLEAMGAGPDLAVTTNAPAEGRAPDGTYL